MSASNIECRYLGWGNLQEFRQTSLADNEALIYTTPTGDVPVLIRGFLNYIRSNELKAKLPTQLSENDLVGAIVAMVRNLPESLLTEFEEWLHNAQKKSTATVVCAVISW
ncbi:hypothetical protein [Gloeocapsopsis sp. IPPAS B-1203]|uniref:hypothetical protein n=1 Tax=Gloeocapsopsis sp. IPPAS B-1203 TaxID=2049454 RepID=UPI000C1A05C5|nr:hypothetical protein [Gloeocapsopsis sp. IPPAS B-1203]PIG90751.1 hypothetical protein CSQ79_25040 [Gloeocapsopsis sp. IPPAS B-1203]